MRCALGGGCYCEREPRAEALAPVREGPPNPDDREDEDREDEDREDEDREDEDRPPPRPLLPVPREAGG